MYKKILTAVITVILVNAVYASAEVRYVYKAWHGIGGAIYDPIEENPKWLVEHGTEFSSSDKTKINTDDDVWWKQGASYSNNKWIMYWFKNLGADYAWMFCRWQCNAHLIYLGFEHYLYAYDNNQERWVMLAFTYGDPPPTMDVYGVENYIGAEGELILLSYLPNSYYSWQWDCDVTNIHFP